MKQLYFTWQIPSVTNTLEWHCSKELRKQSQCNTNSTQLRHGYYWSVHLGRTSNCEPVSPAYVQMKVTPGAVERQTLDNPSKREWLCMWWPQTIALSISFLTDSSSESCDLLVSLSLQVVWGATCSQSCCIRIPAPPGWTSICMGTRNFAVSDLKRMEEIRDYFMSRAGRGCRSASTQQQDWLCVFTQGGTRGAMPDLHDIANSTMTPVRYWNEILRAIVWPYDGGGQCQPCVARVCRHFLNDRCIDTINWPLTPWPKSKLAPIWHILYYYISQSLKSHIVQTVQNPKMSFTIRNDKDEQQMSDVFCLTKTMNNYQNELRLILIQTTNWLSDYFAALEKQVAPAGPY